jgi:holliday junction DNA helicase RuvA
MYNFLRGRLAESSPGRIILDVGGMGYELAVPVTSEIFVTPGSELTLWTHLHFAQDGQHLFGFTQRTQRDLFRMLIKVSGVGPKVGLQIISGIQPEELVQVMVSEDWKRLTRIPGIGPKTARRLLIELKEKLTEQELAFIPSGGVPPEPVFNQAFSALSNLGFQPDNVRLALKEISAESALTGIPDLESILKKAIAKLAP